MHEHACQKHLKTCCPVLICWRRDQDIRIGIPNILGRKRLQMLAKDAITELRRRALRLNSQRFTFCHQSIPQMQGRAFSEQINSFKSPNSSAQYTDNVHLRSFLYIWVAKMNRVAKTQNSMVSLKRHFR